MLIIDIQKIYIMNQIKILVIKKQSFTFTNINNLFQRHFI